MNKELLQQIADYVRTVPQSNFDMSDLFECVVGHSYGASLINSIFYTDEIMYEMGLDESEFEFITSSDWDRVDNTPVGASKRIEYLIEYGLPEDWRLMMEGKVPLCY